MAWAMAHPYLFSFLVFCSLVALEGTAARALQAGKPKQLPPRKDGEQ